ncbi:MAG: GspE/PulE family protein [Campylobacterota bacterium]|nr:GspE/PulE family protein [Campylobacterota bacterium]
MKQNNLLEHNIDYTLLDTIDSKLDLEKYSILPISNDILYLLVATSNINLDINIINKIFNQPIKLIYVEHKSLEFEWKYLKFKRKLYDLAIEALNDKNHLQENSSILEFMDTIFYFCIQNEVSDIHLEVLDKSIVLRLRIDGVLNQFFRFKSELYLSISSIVKYLSSLDISQKRLPLNGRFTREIENKHIDFRLSTIPTIYGESIVIRVLDNNNIKNDLEHIEFEPSTFKTIKKTLNLSAGMILVTGPTGSGKTTTLYSMLNTLNTNKKKIITIEDPVEYKLDGIIQVNINNDITLDYTTILKNILRQDPDILMIGEIRDKESLQIAMQASLTGHLVISTLHTNSAIETITRLKDLNAPNYLIASTIKMILSQRLLRVLCQNCKKLDTNTNSYKAIGCISCNLTGYQNRKVVSEVIEFDDILKDMISNNNTMIDIQKYLKENSFKTMKKNGMDMVNQGISSLEEYYSKI